MSWAFTLVESAVAHRRGQRLAVVVMPRLGILARRPFAAGRERSREQQGEENGFAAHAGIVGRPRDEVKRNLFVFESNLFDT
ncbi:MAG TPA: hypothetical protein VNU64_18070 [Burkholderiales bacterium]|nr:hypothetical protein [Burkholderiales bacterium]